MQLLSKMRSSMAVKRLLWSILLLIIIIMGISVYVFSQAQFGSLPKGERLEHIKHSSNYVNGEFKNLSPTPVMTENENRLKIMMKFLFRKKEQLSPVDSIPSIKTDLKRLNTSANELVWFGHSSYFMQINGKRILVDPVFSGHASPFSWMVKAFKGTDIFKAEDIPDIDYLIITHDHWDHLDYETVMKLKPMIKKVICGLGVGSHFEYWGFNPKTIIELDWYEGAFLGDNWEIIATPARHFSGRGLKSNQTLWASFVLKSPSLKLFLGGDGGYDNHFEDIGNKYGPFDLAILEQGQYDQNWKYIHLLPDLLFKVATDLRAKRVLPVHNSKFALANHAWTEPMNKIVENSKMFRIPVLTPMIGEPVYLSDTTQNFTHWWVKPTKAAASVDEIKANL